MSYRERLAALGLAMLLLPAGAHAFGFKTHLWIAEQLIQDAKENCVLRIRSVRNDGSPDAAVGLEPALCHSIRDHEAAFRAGTLGPDTYPDLVTGQVTTHPGSKDGWVTSDWLEHVYKEAKPGPDLAFAAGYLVHAASDVFAHTYVNAWSGDVFDLLDGDQRVEARHFLIEKYIDAKLPPVDYSRSLVVAPAGFVRDRLIHNTVAAQASKKAVHIATMQAVWAEVAKMRRDVAELRGSRGAMEASLRTQETAAGLKVVASESALKSAERLLQLASPANAPALQANVSLARQDLASARQEWTLLTHARKQLVKLLSQSQHSVRVLDDWSKAMDVAAVRYVESSEAVTDAMIRGENTLRAEYDAWWRCYGRVYEGIPMRVANEVCLVEAGLENLDTELEDYITTLLPDPLSRIYGNYLQVVRALKADLRVRARAGAQRLALGILPNRAGTQDFAELLSGHVHASADALNAQFSKPNAPGQRALLVIDGRMTDILDRDMALQDGVLQPERFKPLYNALVLSRVALLDFEGLRSLARQMGADDRAIRVPSGGGRHSVLYEMLRSIDGNHQWQPFGLPYPMQDGKELYSTKSGMNFGFGPADKERGGLALFVDDQLRERVFRNIFQGPLHEHLHALPQAAGYPYPECAERPFAIAFDAQGRHVTRDPQAVEVCGRAGR